MSILYVCMDEFGEKSKPPNFLKWYIQSIVMWNKYCNIENLQPITFLGKRVQTSWEREKSVKRVQTSWKRRNLSKMSRFVLIWYSIDDNRL